VLVGCVVGMCLQALVSGSLVCRMCTLPFVVMYLWTRSSSCRRLFFALYSHTILPCIAQVEFVSEQGLDEAGIDGGGLFKEFMDAFAKAAFSPDFGLFVPTSHQLLTPSPDSASAGGSGGTGSSSGGGSGGEGSVGENHLKYLHFIGRILGKAVYEV